MTATLDLSVSPLLAARTALAAAVEAATGYETHPSYTEGFATPCVILTGAGWEQSASGVAAYTVNVACLYANQSGDLADGVEEMARRVAVAVAAANWGVPPVPAPAAYTVGDRQYAGVTLQARAAVALGDI